MNFVIKFFKTNIVSFLREARFLGYLIFFSFFSWISELKNENTYVLKSRMSLGIIIILDTKEYL